MGMVALGYGNIITMAEENISTVSIRNASMSGVGHEGTPAADKGA
jgi:hypothetical protein